MATGLTEHYENYMQEGIEYVHERAQLLVDMAQPRTITVLGVNSLTDKKKIYILNVTEKGICLV